MIGSLLNLCSSCFNASLNVFTRVVLIVISASLYQGFVLAEVFLNSYNVVYPPYLAKPLAKGQSNVSRVVGYAFKIIAIEVNASSLRFNTDVIILFLCTYVCPYVLWTRFKFIVQTHNNFNK